MLFLCVDAFLFEILPNDGLNDATKYIDEVDRMSHTVRPAPRKPRVALYSHDALGLGHMRRNALIAQTIAGSPLEAVVLLISGAKELNAMCLGVGVDCVTLPALTKDGAGEYRPRNLEISCSDLMGLRAMTIRAALDAFKPDIFIVDKLPRGVCRELDPALELLRRTGTRCVLGLRDILDDPTTVAREWRENESERAVADFYETVWVYGDPTVYDLLREYNMSTRVAEKVRFTGYLDSSRRIVGAIDPEVAAAIDSVDVDTPLVFCAVGGGQDGAELAETFADAALPHDSVGVLLTGPFMPAATRQHLQSRAAKNPKLRLVEFTSEPAPLLRRADRVIAMGGYNTVCEVLCMEKSALIVPRTSPRTEQLIRAERFRNLGALDLLDPASMTPAALTDWLEREIQAPVGIADRIDFNGLSRIPHLATELLAVA